MLEGARPVLYFFDPQYGFIFDNGGLNSQFLRAVCMESLATLGLLDVAYIYPHRLWPDLKSSLNGDLPFCGRYDGLLYVRLNPLGAYVLGCAESYEYLLEAGAKLFRVLPNLEVVLANGPLNPADRANLELLVAPKSEMVWALDSERMLSHVQTGGNLKELRAFLEQNAAEGLPANVQVFLQELEYKTGACHTLQEALRKAEKNAKSHCQHCHLPDSPAQLLDRPATPPFGAGSPERGRPARAHDPRPPRLPEPESGDEFEWQRPRPSAKSTAPSVP